MFDKLLAKLKAAYETVINFVKDLFSKTEEKKEEKVHMPVNVKWSTVSENLSKDTDSELFAFYHGIAEAAAKVSLRDDLTEKEMYSLMAAAELFDCDSERALNEAAVHAADEYLADFYRLVPEALEIFTGPFGPSEKTLKWKQNGSFYSIVNAAKFLNTHFDAELDLESKTLFHDCIEFRISLSCNKGA